jgi:S1-C subfamily serine protease
MDQLIRYGEVKRGRIGVAIQDLTPDLAQAMSTSHTTGAVIAKVEPGSSADRAGLKSGDLVIAVNGAPVRSGTQLRNTIGLSRIGDEVELTVDRRGSEQKIGVRIEQAVAESTPPQRQRPRQQQQR